MDPAAALTDDTLVSAALVMIVAAAGFAVTLRAAGVVSAKVTGVDLPSGSWANGLAVLLDPAAPGTALGTPRLAAWAYWLTVALFLTTALLVMWVGWRMVDRSRHRNGRDPSRLAGTATRRDVRASASRRTLLARAATLRPSLSDPEPGDVGYLLGHAHGQQVWASVEDSILLLGPPRSGKGLHIVINAILDAPGAVITTSTRQRAQPTARTPEPGHRRDELHTAQPPPATKRQPQRIPTLNPRSTQEHTSLPHCDLSLAQFARPCGSLFLLASSANVSSPRTEI